jgi:hypothetical protein
MPNPFPYFRWFAADAASDEAYSSMNDQERGFFHRCLNHAWMNDGLPGDMDQLAAVMRVTRKYLDRIWPHVKTCGGWLLTDTVHPRWINERQEKERDYARTKSAASGKGSPFAQKGIPGFLYLMRRPDGAVKIGSSLNVPRRLAQLRYKSNLPIELLGKVKVESMGDAEIEAHNKYAASRLTGEWFQLNNDDINTILGDITPEGDKQGDIKGGSEYHLNTRAYDSVSVSVSSKKLRKDGSPSFEDINAAWRWYQSEFPGDVNEFVELQLFLSIMETPEDLADLRKNLPLWKLTDKWVKRFYPSSENFLSKRMFKITPKLDAPSPGVGQYKTKQQQNADMWDEA